MKVNLTIGIPSWLDKICAWPVIVYRKWKFGYSFRKIFLGEGEFTILDVQDYYRYCAFKWIMGGQGSTVYAVRSTKIGAKITTRRLHREIMNAPKGLLVDHENGDTLDNRRANLRLATHFQNTCNRRKTKSKTASRFVGLCWEKTSSRWVTHIQVHGKKIYLGRFKSEIDAAKAYDEAAKKYHGAFAHLNFPEAATPS
ncbi:MAG: AP2 domain-containing protein [Sedimentisphaerales bacterium]|jgi:hypothetical protein